MTSRNARQRQHRLGAFLGALLLAWTIALAGCGGTRSADTAASNASAGSAEVSVSDTSTSAADGADDGASADESDAASLEWQVDGTTTTVEVEEGAYYYDLEHVVTYLVVYDELPENYITKSEARDLGWEGGTPERFLEGAAIGGSTFGNREQILPANTGATYYECDLNTNGASSRGAERLIWSSDEHYYHTEDHYESFVEYVFEDGVVTEGDSY